MLTKDMAKENFVLLSLDDEKAKAVANVVSNKTCRILLEALTQKDATESDLAKHTNLPLSTVHYNLQQLVEAGLVVVEEFHYSTKGREVNHYKLANKYIIIAPKSTKGIAEKLKGILPLAAIAAGSSFLVWLFNNSTQTLPTIAPMAADISQKAVAEEAFAMAAPIAAEPNVALWFAMGAAAIVIAAGVLAFFRRT